ncbi:MAG: pseudouridine synthase [Taibaiella sp.]|nr:pseudouridine synthase [Taibaiella sp.]
MATYLIYKPYGMHSQFSREEAHHTTLADLDYAFGKDVYPVGRLDADSEGLLILSNDKSLNQSILHPHQKQVKTYWVQVEGIPADKDLELLGKGISIRIKGKEHQTLPAAASVLNPAPDLPERIPPIRYRKNIPDTWVRLSIMEGKNRQVRRMMAAIGFPVLRLVRAGLLNFELGKGMCKKMKPGNVIQINTQLI